MANTYEDNPARGLSKLQKAILVWLEDMHEAYRERGADYLVTGDGPGVPWGYRPTFYGRPLNIFGGPTRFWYGETPAVSRSLARLEERGLVKRSRPYWHHNGKRTRSVRLTEIGEATAKRLIAAGETAKYKDKRSKALAELYMLARGDNPCPVCGEPVNREGHCSTPGCVNNPECDPAANRFESER